MKYNKTAHMYMTSVYPPQMMNETILGLTPPKIVGCSVLKHFSVISGGITSSTVERKDASGDVHR